MLCISIPLDMIKLIIPYVLNHNNLNHIPTTLHIVCITTNTAFGKYVYGCDMANILSDNSECHFVVSVLLEEIAKLLNPMTLYQLKNKIFLQTNESEDRKSFS